MKQIWLYNNPIRQYNVKVFVYLNSLEELGITLEIPKVLFDQIIFEYLPESCVLHLVGGQIRCTDIGVENVCNDY